MTLVFVALAGGLGALCRFVFDAVVNRRVHSSLPVATMAINILGSFLLGLLTALTAHHLFGADATVKSIVGTGFCGGFTTFSTASVEATRLWHGGGARPAAAYAVSTLVGSLLAAALGLGIGAALA